MGVYLLTGGLLLLYLILAWFVGSWLGLKSPDIWILRGGLALIGFLGALSFLWFYRKRSKAEEAPEVEAAGAEDVGILVQEALRALKRSTLGRGASLQNLPLLLFVGEPGSAKTHIVVRSGLDPELLAGQAYQENEIIPTRLANIWYTQPAIVLDPAGNLLTQPDRWKRLVQLVRPGRAASALSKSQQAPRAAVVCYDCANFLRPGANEVTLSSARKLSARVHDISQTLGISLPVYVLFTKLDRLPGFTEFAHGLTPDEASQVLGTTLPIRSSGGGVYSEEETKRLGSAFDELFYSLSARRIELLARENDQEALPPIYEFPRELRKLRTLLVQFLVELGRPSQLRVNPFLRGFYFSGVRPLLVQDGISAAPQPANAAASSRIDAGATQIFSTRSSQPAAAAVVAHAAGARKVPQWTFLTRLFNDVIVKDKVALAASGISSNVNLIRRIGLITITILALICIVGFTISFFGNRQLEQNVTAAATDLQRVQVGAHQLPSYNDLEKLEKVRQELSRIATYQQNGVPLHLRWGLYVGDKIYSDARRVYFTRFKQLLFDDAQSVILADLRRLPDQPGPNDVFDTPYNELKAHLITAGYNQYSSREFPSRVLTTRWSEANQVDAGRTALAGSQFEFYSAELKAGNPLSIQQQNDAVQRARNYLSKFGGVDRYYQPLIEQVSRATPDAVFSSKFPDATGVVLSRHSVRGAFTPVGFDKFSAAVRDPARALAAEEWVLGPTTARDLDQVTLERRLMQKYQQDFIKEWELVLAQSTVPRFQNPADADKKLDQLSSVASPLLELLWFISSNTNINDVKEPFTSVQALEPPSAADRPPEQLKQPSNLSYLDALGKLQGSVHILAQSPNPEADSAGLSAVMADAAAAKRAAAQATGPRLDNQYHTEQQLERVLEEPILNVETIFKQDRAKDLNGAGQAICAQFNQLSQKFPLKPTAAQEVSIDEFNGFFAPKTGALWKNYDQKIAKFITKVGNRYQPAESIPVVINPAFLSYLNHMAAVTDALYASGQSVPNFSYSLALQQTNIGGLILSVNDQVLAKVGDQKKLTWSGRPSEMIRVTARDQTYDTYDGPWAVFRFAYNGSEVSHSLTNLRWNLLKNDGKPVLIKGEQAYYTFQLQAGPPSPFEIVKLAGVRCEPAVAK